MDLVSLTRGYFNKTMEEQELTVNTICADVLIKMMDRSIQLKDTINEIDSIIKEAEGHEDYEIAEVLKLVKTELTNGL
jgi:hypothetical protein